jgi:pyruvate kinase
MPTCELGDQTRVGLDYKELVRDVARGATLLLDDGRVEMWVEEVQGNEVHCKVIQGGVLSNNKGINRKGGGLSAAALTEKDMEDIKTAAMIKADYLAVSFPRSAADVELARDPARRWRQGLDRIQDRACRGHRSAGRNRPGFRCDHGGARRPGRGSGRCRRAGIAKAHDRAAREQNKVVITATQMMESMISRTRFPPVPKCPTWPTRCWTAPMR